LGVVGNFFGLYRLVFADFRRFLVAGNGKCLIFQHQDFYFSGCDIFRFRWLPAKI
jgi:hypothetical protein